MSTGENYWFGIASQAIRIVFRSIHQYKKMRQDRIRMYKRNEEECDYCGKVVGCNHAYYSSDHENDDDVETYCKDKHLNQKDEIYIQTLPIPRWSTRCDCECLFCEKRNVLIDFIYQSFYNFGSDESEIESDGSEIESDGSEIEFDESENESEELYPDATIFSDKITTECVVCTEVISGPFIRCINNHEHCYGCMKKVWTTNTRCPQCRTTNYQ